MIIIPVFISVFMAVWIWLWNYRVEKNIYSFMTCSNCKSEMFATVAIIGFERGVFSKFEGDRFVCLVPHSERTHDFHAFENECWRQIRLIETQDKKLAVFKIINGKVTRMSALDIEDIPEAIGSLMARELEQEGDEYRVNEIAAN